MTNEPDAVDDHGETERTLHEAIDASLNEARSGESADEDHLRTLFADD